MRYGIADLSQGRSNCAFDSTSQLSGHNSSSYLLITTNDNELREIVFDAARQLGCPTVFFKWGGATAVPSESASAGLLLIDHDVRDIPALDIAKEFRRHRPALPFVLVGKGLTVSQAVEAMKLGAFTVLEKPVSRNAIVTTFRHALGGPNAAAPSPSSGSRESAAPRSTLERWALHVLKACDADGDLRTLGQWASFAGLSYSSLCESCRLVGIQPHDARDFARVLRAVVQSEATSCRFEELLDISDRRTLKAMLARAGLDVSDAGLWVTVDQFLMLQRFVPTHHAALAVLRAHLVR